MISKRRDCRLMTRTTVVWAWEWDEKRGTLHRKEDDGNEGTGEKE